MKRCVYRTDYKLITNDNRDYFETEINELLQDGWVLHNQLIMTAYPFYCREMTREVMIMDSKGEPVIPGDK